ncbi:TraR/DksA family transcriptional regulator [Thermodesulfobacteriota bacterium]
MTRQDLLRFKIALEELHQWIISRGIEELKESSSRLELMIFNVLPTSDEMDSANFIGELSTRSRIHDHEIKFLHKIKEALERIESGAFGRCEMCGEPINIRRLSVRPLSTHCLPCKGEREREEKKLTDENDKYPTRSIIHDWS